MLSPITKTFASTTSGLKNVLLIRHKCITVCLSIAFLQKIFWNEIVNFKNTSQNSVVTTNFTLVKENYFSLLRNYFYKLTKVGWPHNFAVITP